MPPLRGAARADRRRPGQVAALPDRAHDGAARAGRGLLPAPRTRVRAVLARPDSRVRAARGHLHRVRVLLGVLGLVGRARAPLRRRDDRAARARERQPRGRARVERRLPAPALPAEGHPRARCRAGAERRGGRGRAGCPDDHRVLRCRAGRRLAAERGSGRPRARQQRPRPGAGHQRLRGGRRGAPRAGRDGDVRVPASREADRAPRVRHDLPRAFLVLLARTRSGRSSGRRGSTSSTSRSSRATAARCASSSSTPARAVGPRRPSPACSRARTCRACATRRRTGASPKACASRSARSSSCSSACGAQGKQVVGYGAPGKGNTLLNYCGIRTDFLDYTVDRNPYKQGKHTPGTHIPIHPPERIAETRPDVILILPWNLAREISDQLAYTAEWGAELRGADPDGDPLRAGIASVDGSAAP